MARTLDPRLSTLQPALSADDETNLGPLAGLPGRWTSNGSGWNLIALPFDKRFRVLVNQYDETLDFTRVGGPVPNRGLDGDIDLVTLDYNQEIIQVAAKDLPESGKAGGTDLPIHHEPGLWLARAAGAESEQKVEQTAAAPVGSAVARLSTIPHGNAVLAHGFSRFYNDEPQIPGKDIVSGRPVSDTGAFGYFEGTYDQFREKPFKGTFENDPDFPGFSPDYPADLLRFANENLGDRTIVRTVELFVDTQIDAGGVLNIPFVVQQADTTRMRAWFWIQTLDGDAAPSRLQYLQVVDLDFLPRGLKQGGGLGGRITWPHISINTLVKETSAEE